MRVIARATGLLLLSVICAGQASAPIPAQNVPQRNEILNNRRVTVSFTTLAPGESTPFHQHDHDLITVYVSGGQIVNSLFGQKAGMPEKIAPGEVRLHGAGYSHAVKNTGTAPFRGVVIEFADPQGKQEQLGTSSHFCNPGSTTVCVDEHNLFCTARVCVEDVTMAPGSVTTKHSHATDHMLVAVSDYELSDEVEGKGTVLRSKKSGEVEYIPAGITHRLTNTGKAAARFTVILWR